MFPQDLAIKINTDCLSRSRVETIETRGDQQAGPSQTPLANEAVNLPTGSSCWGLNWFNSLDKRQPDACQFHTSCKASSWSTWSWGHEIYLKSITREIKISLRFNFVGDYSCRWHQRPDEMVYKLRKEQDTKRVFLMFDGIVSLHNEFKFFKSPRSKKALRRIS